MTCGVNMYTSKILYESNHNKLTYKYVRDDGFTNNWNNEYSDFKRYNSKNRDKGITIYTSNVFIRPIVLFK